MSKGKNVIKILNRKIKTETAIIVLLYVIAIIISVTLYMINKATTNIENENLSSVDSTDYIIDLEDNTVIYEKECKINLQIKDFDKKSNYEISVNVNDISFITKEKVESDEKLFNIEFDTEGQKNINIIIYKNDEEKYNRNIVIYYINPYKKQFLDELTNKSVQCHYRTIKGWENYPVSLDRLEKLGAKNIRMDIFKDQLSKKNGKYNFSYFDECLEEISKKNIKVLIIINGFEGKKINTEERIKEFENFEKELVERYPQVKRYEILNETNIGSDPYRSEEDMKYYSNLLKISNEIAQGKDIEIVAGAAANILTTTEKTYSGNDYLDNITKSGGYKYSSAYSYHPYGWKISNIQDGDLNVYLTGYKKIINQGGGFIKNYATEYGFSNYSGRSEDLQAIKLIQHTTLIDKYGLDFSNIYNFWNKGTDENNSEQNFGLVRNDYTPKLSYYSMKNYYQNTNGSEYIGYINSQSELEEHIYNKDGNPLIIAWSNNSNNTFDFTLNGMEAKDIYGNDIHSDEAGNIKITTSPVYLYNVPTSYFYKAISNVITTKYDEFLTTYDNYISQISNLSNEVNNLKQQIQDIANNSNLDEEIAINLMKSHYNLGTKILEAYKSGTIQIEDVKVSSMLDFLDDIGDSFEDLVTVSATTRNADLNITLNKINETENLIKQFNTDIEIVYPSKILQFSKDFYEKANYINGVDEENPIKTGLIVSKNLHSELLSDWAKYFASIYIDKYVEEYIATYPVEIVYSITELTNQDVTATLVSQGQFEAINEKSFTFKNNGTFLFEYTVKGRKLTKLATVSNIDKTPPQITGVENDRLYLGKVIPIIEDDNLKEVGLYKDSKYIGNYVSNTPILEEGTYKIVAEDKAKNKKEIEFYISYNPVQIEYSTTEITNKPVEAKVVSNFEVQVNNNSNSNIHIFNENAEFKFECTVKGTKIEIKAVVNNIDKIYPTITGIQNNTVYLEPVIPISEDENLKQVELYKDSSKVENYMQNTKINEDGTYKIIATDKAGNKTELEFDIYSIPATIEYSNTEWTNKNVTAKIVSKANIQVQNNNKNKEYIFKQNGNFEFKYKIRNQDFTIEAKVSNIDKKIPQITGVEEKTLYIDEATPMVTDENLDNVKLYMNSEEVKNYKLGTKLTQEGIYEIVATDKATNKLIVNFAIMENEDKEYQIKDPYILNVSAYTSKEDFDKNLQLNVEYRVLREGKEISNDDKIVTGDIIKLNNGKEYTIIVKGDINKDGRINISDIIRLRNYLLTRNALNDLEIKAADCNVDGKGVSIADLIRLRILILYKNVNKK